MTEKRFAEVKGYCYDKKTCIGVIQDDYTCKNMINLLNEQEETIQELRKERDYFERKKEEFLSRWSIVHSENIQLKERIKELQQLVEDMSDYIEKLGGWED